MTPIEWLESHSAMTELLDPRRRRHMVAREGDGHVTQSWYAWRQLKLRGIQVRKISNEDWWNRYGPR